MLFHWRTQSEVPAIDPRFGERVTFDRSLGVRGGFRALYAYVDAQHCMVTDEHRTLLSALQSEGVATEFSPDAISQLLHHGPIRAPRTIREGVLRLGEGDRLVVHQVEGRFESACEFEFQFASADSRQDQVASTDRLLEHLSGAIERSIGRDPAVLLLSSGKDSVALAIACREAGRSDVRALTYAVSDRDEEAADAAAFARKLGLDHEIVLLPDDTASIEAVMDRAFESASEPCGDPATVPYMLAISQAGLARGTHLVDGTLNDSYFGFMLTARERRQAHIADGWLRPLRGLRPIFPAHSTANASLRNRAEWSLFGGRWLRHCDTKHFFEASVDTHADWAAISDENRHLDDFDFRSTVRGRHMDPNAVMLKGRLAAELSGATATFPYANDSLRDYVFNLPEADRFDRIGLVNKVLLRRMLRATIDYDDARIGKRVFDFDGPGFLTRHRSYVEHEITSCRWWNPSVKSLLNSQIDRPATLAKTWPSLLALYQVSGWLRRHAD